MSNFGVPGSGPWTTWPVGARVMVRKRIDSAESGTDPARYTDILGIVVATSVDSVRILRDPPRAGHPDPWDPGTEYDISAADFVTGKRIPPRPERRARRTPCSDDD